MGGALGRASPLSWRVYAAIALPLAALRVLLGGFFALTRGGQALRADRGTCVPADGERRGVDGGRMGPSSYPSRYSGAPLPRLPAPIPADAPALGKVALGLGTEHLDLDFDVGACLGSSSEFSGYSIDGSGQACPLPADHWSPRHI